MNAIIDKRAIAKVAEAFPDVTEEQITEVVTLRVQFKRGYRKIGKKANLKKDKARRVYLRYECECEGLQPKPSRLEREVVRLRARVAEEKGKAELQEEEEVLQRHLLLYSMKARGNDFIGDVINRKLMKDFTKEFYFKEIRKFIVTFRHYKSPDLMLLCSGISLRELLAEFNDWYPKRREEIYRGTNRFAIGEECLALEVYEYMFETVRLIRPMDARERERAEKSAQSTLDTLIC